MEPSQYIGLLSGTSVDGVDAVLCGIGETSFSLDAASTTPYPEPLKRRIDALILRPEVALAELGGLDRTVGEFFAECALALLREAGVEPGRVQAIGHHGQTVFHRPQPPEPFTLQIGDPNIVAARTGIPTVGDLRRLDVALGGQGAPLVPAFHAWRFAADDEPRTVVNIGGIANLTVLVPNRAVTGFDTGPGNTLLDRWIERVRGEPFDRNGAFSAAGAVDPALLERLLDEPYLRLPPPKSTGRELFNAAWLDARLDAAPGVAPQDVQATLAEFTARTIVDAVRARAPECRRLLVCGGGAHNADLMARLHRLSGLPVETTAAYGVPPDWVEGAAFAWLAWARLNGHFGNVPTVTGAARPALLGGVYSIASPAGASAKRRL